MYMIHDSNLAALFILAILLTMIQLSTAALMSSSGLSAHEVTVTIQALVCDRIGTRFLSK